jgi:hypothetical protein
LLEIEIEFPHNSVVQPKNDKIHLKKRINMHDDFLLNTNIYIYNHFLKGHIFKTKFVKFQIC